MNNNQFRTACALRLGARICHSHTCICGAEVGSDGVHGLSCKKSAGRHPRHSACNDLIKRSLCSADFSAIREPLGVSRSDGKRPDGMTMLPWKNGKCLLWDYTCSDTLAPSNLNASAKEAGKAAKEGEVRKIILCKEKIDLQKHPFSNVSREVSEILFRKTKKIDFHCF